METNKGKKRRMKGDCRGCILKATITDGKRERWGHTVDHRRLYNDYLKKQNLLVYGCNYYSEGDPRILWYVQGPYVKLEKAIAEGHQYNNGKAVGEKNIFRYATKKYDEVLLPKIPYDPNYSNCDFPTFMAALEETYEGIIMEPVMDEVEDEDEDDVDEPLFEQHNEWV